MTRRAFTLIELLVVISVIAVLLAILMPSLQVAKKQAGEVVCRSNLRQYGVTGSMYLGDNDEKFPNPQTWLFIETEIIVPCAWHDASAEPDGVLWFYLKDKDVHLCPTFNGLARSRGAEHSQHNRSIPIEPRYSYSMNYYLGSGIGGGVRKATEVRHPSEVMFFSEENCWTIEGLSIYALNNNILWITQTNPIDCLATYHRAKGGDLNSGVANIVFVDGSVGTGLAEDGYELAYPRRQTSR